MNPTIKTEVKSKNRVNCIDCFDLDNDGVGIPGGFGFFVEMMMELVVV